MALMQRCLFRSNSFVRCGIRCFSTPTEGKDIKKSVFISQSKDVYTNLALEDWLYRNFDFSKHQVLMLWQNAPSVTIGKDQNPWQKLNVTDLENVGDSGAKFARRNTDGDAIYHDEGALNMTFFTTNSHHNAKYNLEIIRRALFRTYGMKIDFNANDLKIRNEKQITETSAKLGEDNAYHHCNILVNVNKINKKLALHKDEMDIISKVLQESKPTLMNLQEANKRITVKSLLSAIGWEYMRTTPLVLKDGGEAFANQQKGFQMINPTENWFPGITEIRNNLASWDWCYGKTPRFSISRSFTVPEHLLNSYDYTNEDLKITMIVEEGKISDVTMYIPPGLSATGFTGEASVVTSLRGHKFSDEALTTLEYSLGGLINDKDRFVTDCVKKVMTSV